MFEEFKKLNSQQERALITFGSSAQLSQSISELGELIGRLAQADSDIKIYGEVRPETMEEVVKESFDVLFTLPQVFKVMETYNPYFWRDIEHVAEMEKPRMESKLQAVE